VSTAQAEVGGKLLEAIAARDFATIEDCFAEDASMRVLTPGPLREFEGAADAAGRFRFWLEQLEGYELLDGDVEDIADRVRVRYRFRGRDPEKGWQENEHTGYAKVRHGRIRALNVTCAGFRPTKAP
jgi:hypothetical protein